ncbi:hypothetical protein EJ05DRAFT_499759 [Pseudovirgaria hyperparasitica]|uniref:Uncharacterized protein n=1 Tax=Pseudovirgaria hyperparasitica TaxID=470096 RepID=A0A6A6WBY0_9PEZI|nr:uncharacterized protein EJ05DRAFT_499759 [Pseudovirgaria hyperparasitica]KAF2759346.1 hypothetical protein EJ05DRAFT_499759 [Pseudovirgaria hyperparasitica]
MAGSETADEGTILDIMNSRRNHSPELVSTSDGSTIALQIQCQNFPEYWKKNLLTLVRSIAGEGFPLEHDKHYITPMAPREPSDSAYGAIAKIVLRDQPHLEAMSAKVMAPEAAIIIATDEDNIIDDTSFRTYLFREAFVTTRDGGVR